MVNQKIIVDCSNLNAKGFGILLNAINKVVENTVMDMYVKTELEEVELKN